MPQKIYKDRDVWMVNKKQKLKEKNGHIIFPGPNHKMLNSVSCGSLLREKLLLIILGYSVT